MIETRQRLLAYNAAFPPSCMAGSFAFIAFTSPTTLPCSYAYPKFFDLVNCSEAISHGTLTAYSWIYGGFLAETKYTTRQRLPLIQQTRVLLLQLKCHYLPIRQVLPSLGPTHRQTGQNTDFQAPHQMHDPELVGKEHAFFDTIATCHEPILTRHSPPGTMIQTQTQSWSRLGIL